MSDLRFQPAERLTKLPPYLFSEIDKAKQMAIEEGVDIINLGIGDPDKPTPDVIVQALAEAGAKPENHQYPSYSGLLDLRREFCSYMKRRFGVELDPVTEALALIGSKEGIAHLPMAYVNPGDHVLVPDPGYPVYAAGTIFAAGIPYYMPLRAQNGFLPDFGAIDPEVAKKAKLLWLNYPNNPTAAVADKAFFEKAVAFAQKYNIILCQDAAYAEVAFDGVRPVSVLEATGAKDVAIEFHSLSKTYNMTGWRIGVAVGNAEIVSALGKVKTNVDSGVFRAIQRAAIAALHMPAESVARNAAVYQERRDVLVEGLRSLGWNVSKPKATFYVWAPVPKGHSSSDLAWKMLSEAGIVVTPGVGFGTQGEGYIRFALTVDKARLAEAIERIRRLKF
jgi:LL-diaminopimelate aminotransferase